ncbi:hypothetical protein [Sphingobium sp. YG1]|uniref:hypothetical protein n=1 Tax=Sphingobium sp. YG1 TaxID=2082188 RepID=UPI000DBB210C|nr:hypothetical protein [Sphingobium sp. YG1]BBC99130.1 hypothetical protein YGS_C1P0386 [Sphingobium sp. YG1]
MKAEELRTLIAQATDSDLADGGRYFVETCHDLTRCRHGEIGEYLDGSDGDLIEWLWNNRHEILRAIEWQPIETAPRDRTLIDCLRDEIRWTDCHFEPRLNCFVRIHGYPSMTEVFTPQPSHWRPRPDGLVDPYTGGKTGKAMSR